jgi:hypothetical protein
MEWILISAAALPFGVAPVFYFLVFTFHFLSGLCATCASAEPG